MISEFGTFEGRTVQAIALANTAGARARILTYGAVVGDFEVPLGDGTLQRVVLGFDHFEDYPKYSPYFGAIAGRYANRIAGARFNLDGRAIELDRNPGSPHCLHGGARGFGKRLWALVDHGASFVTLSLVSESGDMGFPGQVTATCTYRLIEPATLRVELTATTDAPTIVNLAHHSYFNLDGSADIHDHELEIDADFYTPVHADGIPTGEIASTAGTPFDFRAMRPIRHAAPAGGLIRYDHNFVLRHRRVKEGMPLHRAAAARSTRNGLRLEVFTTEPGLQFYDGHKFAIPTPGLGGQTYAVSAGFALEPQMFPNSPNIAHFPDPTLRPDEIYRQTTEYRFSI